MREQCFESVICVQKDLREAVERVRQCLKRDDMTEEEKQVFKSELSRVMLNPFPPQYEGSD